MATQQKFMIIDGSSLLYRAFYALPPLTSPGGEYTNAIYGFANMLLKLWQDETPTYLVIAFDKGKHTFRHDKFPEYKGTRQKTPPELLSQIPLLREFAAAADIAFVEREDYEADDIIGTLATKAAANGMMSLVVTGDRDALQLVRKNLTVLLTKKGISNMARYDETAFREEYGIPPLRLIDLKGLMGDSSDNIPGVPGVGPKTALKLLQEYGSLEAVLENCDNVTGKKLREKLRENQNLARLSRELATIECNVPDISFTPEAYLPKPQRETLRTFCQRYGLKAVWKNYQKILPPENETATLFSADNKQQTKAAAQLTWREIRTEEELANFLSKGPLALATTYDESVPHPRRKISDITLCRDDELAHITLPSPWEQSLADLLTKCEEVAVFDAKSLYHAGFREQQNFFDIELAAYLLQPELAKYEVNALLTAYCPTENFPCPEAASLFKLYRSMKEELRQNNLIELYQDMELPLAKVLGKMEERGIYVNRHRLAEKNESIAKIIADLAQDIYTLAGQEFNIQSPKQLGEILFDKLGLPPAKKTKTGYSTNAEVLENLRYQHPIVERILSYRLWTKLKSTYLEGIKDLVDENTGRIHTNFNQTVTATGRLSSSEPNLQNIPVRREEGKAIRALFEPGPGYDTLLSADYSQIELRLLAHMSGDEGFIGAFLAGEDVHARTAAEVFNVPLDQVTAEERRRAKAVNFGIVYGISDYGLSQDLHITRKEAGEYIKLYFAKYPKVKAFLENTVAQAKENGYVTTLYGRKRNLPAIKSANFAQRSLAERMAMNTPIQGSAADIIKLAMIRAEDMLQAAKVKSRILLQVHDELVLEIVESEREQVVSILREAMERVAELKVPLVIDISSGKNWAEAK